MRIFNHHSHSYDYFINLVCNCPGHLFSFSIQQEHCEIKNEDSKKITIKAIGDAKVLVNGEPVDDDEVEELHHLDRCYIFTFLYWANNCT